MIATNTAFTVFSGLGLVLSLIPLWWHLESWNAGTCMFMIWTAAGCLVYLVDSIVWSGNIVNWAPVWCEIAIRIKIGVSVALPACALCILRRLYYITLQTSRTQKLRAMIIDLSITVGIPVVEMILQYTVAKNRFDIVEDFGCTPATSNTSLSYVLVFSWPLVIAVISACYGALTIRTFVKRRKQFKDFLKANGNSTYNRYWRLVILASLDFCLTLPLTIRGIVAESLLGVSPWVSWADTHSGYSRVFEIPRSVLDQNTVTVSTYEIGRWTPVLGAYLFFGFFGFTDEARRNYRLLASTVAKFLGFTMSAKKTPTPNSRVVDHPLSFALPTFNTQRTVSRTDSDSFSDNFSTAANKLGLGVQYHSPAKQPSSSTSLSIDEVPRVPEPVLSPPSVRRPFVPGDPRFVHLCDGLDRL